MTPFSGPEFGEETTGRFCKRAGLANVPSSRFFVSSFRFCTQRTAEGASGKGPRQETSKSVKEYSRHFVTFSRRAKIFKNVFRHFSTIFARHQFSGPFWGALMCLRSGLLGPGTPVLVPSFRFLGSRNICQNHPFGNHKFANPRKLLKSYDDFHA